MPRPGFEPGSSPFYATSEALQPSLVGFMPAFACQLSVTSCSRGRNDWPDYTNKAYIIGIFQGFLNVTKQNRDFHLFFKTINFIYNWYNLDSAMSVEFFFNFGNPMREHTITIPDKKILEEIGLSENDSNIEEGSFERTKHALGKKLDRGELESDVFCGGSGPNVASQLAIRGIPSIVFAGFGRGDYNGADEIGRSLIRDLRGYGVDVLPVYKDIQSCEIFTLKHTWDLNRTFASKLAAAKKVTLEEVPYNYLELAQ